MRLPDCNFTLLGEEETFPLLLDAIRLRTPYSFIRLGDGEGVLLSLGDEPTPGDIQYLHQHLGDAAKDSSVRARLRRLLISSINDADLIGVRDDIVDVNFDSTAYSSDDDRFLDSFRRQFKLREPELELGADGARRIVTLHKVLSSIEFSESHAFCSAWMHYKLHSSGLLLRLLRRQRRIGIVSCRSKLPSLLSELLGIEVAFYQIPEMYRHIKGPCNIDEYVKGLEAPLHETLVEFPGMLFLVGGGLYGKAYCSHIKQLGGIALDVGSLLDAWVGIPSRPTVYASDYADTPQRNGVPVTLLLDGASVERADSDRVPEPTLA